MATIIKQYPTFISGANTTTGLNKSMLSLINGASSSINIKLHEIWIRNTLNTSTTGTIINFQLKRITGHTNGTNITIQPHDTNDTLDGYITVKKGAAVSGESTNTLWRWLMSGDFWTAGALDLDGFSAVMAVHFPVWKRLDDYTRPIILRPGEGIHIKCATNNTNGDFDLAFVFTTELK